MGEVARQNRDGEGSDISKTNTLSVSLTLDSSPIGIAKAVPVLPDDSEDP